MGALFMHGGFSRDCAYASCFGALRARRLAAATLKTRIVRVLSNPLSGSHPTFLPRIKKAPFGAFLMHGGEGGIRTLEACYSLHP